MSCSHLWHVREPMPFGFKRVIWTFYRVSLVLLDLEQLVVGSRAAWTFLRVSSFVLHWKIALYRFGTTSGCVNPFLRELFLSRPYVPFFLAILCASSPWYIFCRERECVCVFQWKSETWWETDQKSNWNFKCNFSFVSQFCPSIIVPASLL